MKNHEEHEVECACEEMGHDHEVAEGEELPAKILFSRSFRLYHTVFPATTPASSSKRVNIAAEATFIVPLAFQSRAFPA